MELLLTWRIDFFAIIVSSERGKMEDIIFDKLEQMSANKNIKRLKHKTFGACIREAAFFFSGPTTKALHSPAPPPWA